MYFKHQIIPRNTVAVFVQQFAILEYPPCVTTPPSPQFIFEVLFPHTLPPAGGPPYMKNYFSASSMEKRKFGSHLLIG
jgi:hypothetical protein